MISGLLLVTIGLVLLLNNHGIVDNGIWLGMLALWPLLLVAIGIALALPRHAVRAREVIAGVTLLALTVGGWAMSEYGQPLRGRVADVGVPLGSATQADVELEMAAGRIILTPGADSGEVVSGTVGLSHEQRLVADGAERGSIAQVRIAAEGRWFRLGINPTGVQPWHLRVIDEVPLRLRVSTGVGEAYLDLSTTTLDEARIDVGIGRTIVNLPGRGRPRVRIEGGIGESIVRIPADTAARVAVGTGIGAASVDETYVRAGDVYTSPGWEDAEERIDVVIDSAIGVVRIEHSD